MELLPGVHLVGSGWLGLSLTHPLDCNVYLVGDADDALLIDAGCGLDTQSILDNIERAGVPAASVRRILLTHAHPDHAAGAASLAAALGAEVLASPLTARILGMADEDAAGLTTARADGLYPPDLVLAPTEVTPLGDRVVLTVGAMQVASAATPGHADGHHCYVLTAGARRAVFTGDLVFARGRVAVLATPDTDVALLAASINRLARLMPAILLPGHAEPVLSNAHTHLGAALDAFDHHRLPPGLVQ